MLECILVLDVGQWWCCHACSMMQFNKILEECSLFEHLCIYKHQHSKIPVNWALFRGQGNIFTRVCHSFCSWGRGDSGSRGVCIQWGVCIWGGGRQTPWDTTWYDQQAGGTHPTGMHSCLCTFCSKFTTFIIVTSDGTPCYHRRNPNLSFSSRSKDVFILERKRKRKWQRDPNLMLTMSNDKDQRKIRFRVRIWRV